MFGKTLRSRIKKKGVGSEFLAVPPTRKFQRRLDTRKRITVRGKLFPKEFASRKKRARIGRTGGERGLAVAGRQRHGGFALGEKNKAVQRVNL